MRVLLENLLLRNLFIYARFISYKDLLLSIRRIAIFQDAYNNFDFTGEKYINFSHNDKKVEFIKARKI